MITQFAPITLWLFLTLWISSCTVQEEKMPFLRVENQRFVDTQNREVILNGINHVVKDPAQNYLYPDDEQLFQAFREYGFNCIRYGIIWDGLEPEPGVINEEYLQEIDKRVRWAEENGIWLVLDMHQDLFSRKFSDGAPIWATLDQEKPHQTGAIWSDAYLMSPAVQQAFDSFWQNAPAEDGVGIQDHYIQVWKVLADRYKNSPAVAGFDVMNEPFMGSQAPLVFEDLLQGYVQSASQSGVTLPDIATLQESFMNETSRLELLETLQDKAFFRQILQAASPKVKAFEENELSAFYQRVRDVIRSTGSRQLLFLEHNYFCNMGIPSYFRVPKDSLNQPDQQCVYAPHGYDLVTDTKALDKTNFNRTEVIFEQIFQNGKEKGLPVWIGEWGAFYMGNNYREAARHIIGMIEQAKAGQTFWCWWPQIETQDFFPFLSRTYPMAIGSILDSYSNTAQGFSCQWRENPSEDKASVWFIPDLKRAQQGQLKIEPASDYQFQSISPESSSGYLIVEPTGKNSLRRLSIQY